MFFDILRFIFEGIPTKKKQTKISVAKNIQNEKKKPKTESSKDNDDNKDDHNNKGGRNDKNNKNDNEQQKEQESSSTSTQENDKRSKGAQIKKNDKKDENRKYKGLLTMDLELAKSVKIDTDNKKIWGDPRAIAPCLVNCAEKDITVLQCYRINRNEFCIVVSPNTSEKKLKSLKDSAPSADLDEDHTIYSKSLEDVLKLSPPKIANSLIRGRKLLLESSDSVVKKSGALGIDAKESCSGNEELLLTHDDCIKTSVFKDLQKVPTQKFDLVICMKPVCNYNYNKELDADSNSEGLVKAVTDQLVEKRHQSRDNTFAEKVVLFDDNKYHLFGKSCRLEDDGESNISFVLKYAKLNNLNVAVVCKDISKATPPICITSLLQQSQSLGK